MAEAAGSLLHDLISDVVPYPIFRVMAGFSNLVYHLLGTANDPTSWSSTLLPPLLTFLMAYFAFVTAYRTVKSMITLAWFGIKWGAILGALIAIWAWWTENTDAVHSTGTASSRGLFDQLSHLGPLVNTLYTQLPDIGSGSAASLRTNRRRSSPYSRRRTRYTSNDDADSVLGTGMDAFTSFFGADTARDTEGVDFSALLRTIVTEGRRQGIDAISALRAAGRVQDELSRFQLNPTAWFDAVGDRFRTPHQDDADHLDQEDFPGGYNTRSRARARAHARAPPASAPTDLHSDSWWWTPPFFKQEQPQ